MDCTERTSALRDEASGREAGFVATARGRVFYTYQPYEGDDANAPLLVIFNGGPGAPTTPYLFAAGTAPRTVVWESAALETPQDNESTWTRFAHLLYLDAPGTGYSYPTVDDGSLNSLASDAAEFVIAMLTFIHCRMDRPDRPVALVGESYGGVRSHAMLWQLHHPGEVADAAASAAALGDEWSADEREAYADLVRGHFSRVASGRGELYTVGDAAFVGRQFFAQILVQPAILHDFGFRTCDAAAARQRPPDLSRPIAPEVVARGLSAVVSPTESLALFGVPIEDIPWMDKSSAIARWFVDESGPEPQPIPPPESTPHYLDAVLGELPPGRSYFEPSGPGVSFPNHSRVDYYLTGLRHTAMFITDATRDGAICSRGIFEGLADAGLIAGHDFRDGEADLVLSDGSERAVRLPRYDAGHAVSFFQPRELSADIEAWLASLRP